MNFQKFHKLEICNDCRILSTYNALSKEHFRSSKGSELRSAKLEILKKLIQENKCPVGHLANHSPD